MPDEHRHSKSSRPGSGASPNLKLLTAAYEAFNARNIDAVLALMHPDVDWPNGMEGGRELGHDSVRKYWTRQWGILNPHVEPIRVEDDESGQTVVTVHQVVLDLAGQTLVDQMIEHVYSVEDGLIRRMDIRGLANPAAHGR